MKDELVTFFIFIEPLHTCVSLQLALIYNTHVVFFFLNNNIYLVTTLLMTILTFTWRKKIKTTYKR